jgi:hypothetical protein
VATEKETLKLDLDATDLILGANKALASIEKIGDAKNVAGLVTGLKNVTAGLAAVGVSLGAFKLALDAVMETEAIERINKQFDTLAEGAGLSGDAIRSKLVGAAQGLADDEEILQAANRAIVSMGKNAEKLPELMELARKATAVMGGEVVNNFEMISNAVASGNTRALRQLGIVVDLEKAQQKYALAHGVTISQLTDEQRKQAMLNAVLAKRDEAFKGIEIAGNSVTILIKKIGVEIGQSLEVITVWVGKLIGPTFQKVFGAIKEYATDARLFLESKMGDAATRASADYDRLIRKQADMKEDLVRLQELQEKWGRGDPMLAQRRAADIERLQKALTDIVPRLEAAREAKEKFEAPGKEGEAARVDTTAADLQNLERKREIEEKTLALKVQTATSEEEVAALSAARKLAIEQELAASIETLRAQGARGEITNVAEQEALLREQAAQRIMQINDGLVANQTAALDRQQKANTTFYQGWKNQSAQAALALSRDQMTWAKAGAIANDTLTKTMAAGFLNISKGSKEALKAMKNQFFLMIADKAQAEGMLHMAAGILNPVEFGVGGALLALSGLIRGLAGGDLGAAGGGGAVSGAAGGLSIPETPAPRPEAQLSPEAGRPGRSVTIAIQGHYFETEQTRRSLMEMIRQETDATEFKYVQIPQSG